MVSENVKVAIYCRLSRDDENTSESESIQNQKLLLTKYAQDKQWDIYDYYCDDGFTGLNFDRPEFQRLKKDVSKKYFSIILCKDQSRIGRDNSGVDNFLHEYLIENKVRCVGVVDNLDNFNQHNKKASQITGLTNEWYSEEISAKVRAAFDAKRRNGQFIGSVSPYGYLKDPNNKNQLIIDDYIAPIIKRIYKMYLDGYGYIKIAHTLENENIPSPSEYKNTNNYNANKSKKRFWDYTMIRRILTNEVYIGNMIQKKSKKISYKSTKRTDTHPSEIIKVEGTHEPIIDMYTFSLVQQMMNKRTKALPETGELHLFSGFIRCGDCGRSMSYRRDIKRFDCSSYLTYGLNSCTKHTIKEKDLHDAVLEDILNMVNLFVKFKTAKEAHERHKKSKDNKKMFDIELSKINKRTQEVLKLKKDIYEDYRNGVLTQEEYLELKKEYNEEEMKLSTRQNTILEERNKIENEINQFEDFNFAFEKFVDLKELNRQILIEYINFIEVYEKEDGLEINIDYKFKNPYIQYFDTYKSDITVGWYNITTDILTLKNQLSNNILNDLINLCYDKNINHKGVS